MSLRVAFIGFRHGHINSLYSMVKDRDDTDIVAACEEDPGKRAELEGSEIQITHDNYDRMLSEVPCDIVACGDYYGIRGERLIQAMEAGRHVVGDKPLCTSLDELARIEALAQSKGLRVGCMLDLAQAGPLVTLRRMVRDGAIGEVHAIMFQGQHPLMYGLRPDWYFEPGKHGGTINDIAIHGIDFLPVLTGFPIVEVVAARAWNARLKQHPEFQDAAMFMLRLENGATALGDVSYLASDQHGYNMPNYWRFTVSGSEGVIEAGPKLDVVRVWRSDSEAVIEEPGDPASGPNFFEQFLADIAGQPTPGGLDTQRVIHSSRITLIAQHAADTGQFPVQL